MRKSSSRVAGKLKWEERNVLRADHSKDCSHSAKAWSRTEFPFSIQHKSSPEARGCGSCIGSYLQSSFFQSPRQINRIPCSEIALLSPSILSNVCHLLIYSVEAL